VESFAGDSAGPGPVPGFAFFVEVATVDIVNHDECETLHVPSPRRHLGTQTYRQVIAPYP